VTSPHTAVEREAGLKRELTPRQLTMIAIGGAIGTGLFLGSTISIRLAGPAVVAVYLAGAVIAYLMTLALTQMAVAHPTAGSFGVHAELYQGRWAGYTVRWTYWFCQVIAIGGEVVASGIYAQFWLPGVPLWVLVVLFSGALVAVNAMHVGAFGSFEYWFAMIKVVAIALFILFGLLIVTGVSPADVPGAAGYRPFAPEGLRGAWLALPVVMFSYLGTEIVAVTSGEARDPERAIPRAMRATVGRLILFYVAAMALLMALVPWREVGTDKSPFVRVFEMVGVPAAASVMNFVVLTAALSSINTNLYLTSRMLFSLARAGDAPALFGRLGSRGTPLAALLASTAGMGVAAVAAKLIPGDAFVFLFGLAIFGGLYVWAQIFLTHLHYLKRQYAVSRGVVSSVSPDGIPGVARWRMAASAAGFLLMLFVIVTTWWVPGMRVTLLSGVPWLLVLTLTMWIAGSRRRPGKHEIFSGSRS
jgi:L-asparagine transporter-like permease